MSHAPFLHNPDFLCLTGSRLYGTARYDALGNCISDEDLRGFVIPPFDYLIGLQAFNEASLEGDHKIWSLKGFFEMLIKGNAQALECLFVPESYIRQQTPLGARVLAMRDAFVGKHYFRSITGFSYSEWRKVRGVAIEVPERTKTEDDVVSDILNVFPHLPKDIKDEIIELLFSQHEKKEVPNRNKVGAKRKLEYEKFGYSSTGAHHALRLLFQCEELLKTGFMTFPRPEAVLLSQVKRGELSFEEIEKLYNDLIKRVYAQYETSMLPDRANAVTIWKLYRETVTDSISEYLSQYR